MPTRLKTLDDVAKHFSTADNGATAVTFAIAVLPLLGLVGAALDYSRAAAVRSDLQRRGDMAALAAAKAPNATFAERRQIATRYVENHVSDLSGLPAKATVVVSEPEPGRVQVDVSAPVQLYIAGLLSNGPVTVASTSAAAVPSDTEVALALDTTGSM